MTLQEWVAEQRVMLTAFEAHMITIHGPNPPDKAPVEWMGRFGEFEHHFVKPIASRLVAGTDGASPTEL